MNSFFLNILIIISTISAQVEYWPNVFNAPPPYVPFDSNYVEIYSKQSKKEGFYNTKNIFTLLKSDSIKKIEQLINYDLNVDHSLNFKDHYLDLSGSLIKKGFPFKFSSLGINWVPIAVLNQSTKSSGIGSIRLGPILNLTYLDIPILLGGGGAINLWKNDMSSKPGLNDLLKSKGDPGFYINIHVGNHDKSLIEGIPLYAEGSIFGQYMQSVDKTKYTSGKIDVLFISDLPFADSIFLYCADTLSKGRAALKYTSTPNRTDNSIQASIGLKNIGNLYFKPSIWYSWAHSSITFPDFENLLGDEQLLKNTITGTIQNDSSQIINYSAGISLSFEKEDWLFRNKLPDTVTIENSELKDSLTANLQDFELFSAKMYHKLEKKFKNNLGFAYTFSIDRHKKIYPNFYYLKFEEEITPRLSADTIREYGDKDNVYFNHLLDLTIISTPKVLFTVFNEFSKNKSIFLRKEKSFLNKTMRIIRIESTLNINPGNPTGITETIGALAKVEEYHFPTFDTINFPTHSRKFYSKCTGTWAINDFLMGEGIWDEVYFDEGYRYPFWKYENSMDTTDKKDAFGPYFISIESGLKLKLSYSISSDFNIKIGSLFRHIYYYDWTGGTGGYRQSMNLSMYPFFELNANIFTNFSIVCGIQRYIDVIKTKNGKDDINKYWEANSSLSYRF